MEQRCIDGGLAGDLRWPAGAFSWEQRSEGERGQRGNARERERVGIQGGVVASLADPGRGGKQEVARARARALRPRACAYWREEEGDRGGEWWAGPLLAAQCWAAGKLR